IKIDVEGGEYGVLKGGAATIKREKPVIIFEHGLGAADVYGTTPEMMYDFLVEKCGLKVSTMSAFLSDRKGFSKSQFTKHFYQNMDYYFVAFP
ncbi:MAG: FkbM family methyltransferase, partial [Bacteroidota bacterium]